MTPEQKVKYLILALYSRWQKTDAPDYAVIAGVDVEEAYQSLVDADAHWDVRNEVRCGDVETEIPCDGGRHYEAKSVASQLPDGTWVGWTHYYGGGKHGEPDAIEWMNHAYDLGCVEEQRTITHRTFTKIQPAPTA